MASLIEAAAARQAKILEQVPAAVRPAIKAEAHYIQNHTPVRFSEALQMAVNSYRDGTLSSKIAQGALREAAAQELAAEFGTDVSEWTV